MMSNNKRQKQQKQQEQNAQFFKDFRDGNKGACDSLVNKYRGHFCEYIKRNYTSLNEDAVTIVNACFAKLYEKAKDIKEPEKIYSWLMTTISRECYNWNKKLIPSDELPKDMESSDPDLAEALIWREGEDTIDSILHAFFPDNKRSSLVNRFIENMDYKEIARIDEGKSNGSTVKQTEEDMEKRLDKKGNAIKTEVGKSKKTLAVLLLAYSDPYLEEFLTCEEIANELRANNLRLSVEEVEKSLSSAHKQFQKHYRAAINQLSLEKRQLLKQRFKQKKDFKDISEENNMGNCEVHEQFHDAKTQLGNELIKKGITEKLRRHISTREKGITKRKCPHE